MLLDDILFLSSSFPFVDMSKSSRVRFRPYVALNIQTIVFLPISIS